MWIERAMSRLAAVTGTRCLPALAVLLFSATLSAGTALAQDEPEAGDRKGSVYILNLDQLQPHSAAERASTRDAWTGFGAVSSPTGVFLPDATAFFEPDGSNERVTFLTPRYQGLQVSWTGDLAEESDDSDSDDGTTARTYVTRPTSVGASFSQGADDFEISLGGDYGRTPQSVPGAIQLLDDEKLLRLGAHARFREFTLGGAFGSDIDPGDLGDTVSWDAFGRYDFGSLAVGFVYNYTIESDQSSSGGGAIPGTLQGGVTYFFTPRMAITTNLAYGSSLDEDGGDDPGLAGVLGFSLDF